MSTLCDEMLVCDMHVDFKSKTCPWWAVIVDSHLQDARLEALRRLPGRLQEAASAAELGSNGVLMSAWTKVLSLLADTDATVRQAAAPVVGCIGVLASKQTSRAGDWHFPAWQPCTSLQPCE